MSTAHDVSLAIDARIGLITVANGYATDTGARVFRGRRRLDEAQIPCAVIIEGDDQIMEQTRGRDKQTKIGQRYIIEGHAACDPDQPNDKAHEIIADMKRAIFSGEWYDPLLIRNMRYIGRTIAPREDGTGLVAASIEIEIEFVESLGTP